MRKSWMTFLILPLGVAGCGGGSDNKDTTAAKAGAPAPGQAISRTALKAAKVPISDFKFVPASITLAKGGTVTFTNQDAAPHTATAKDNSFDTDTLKKGQSKKITFSKAGTFAYYCQFHSFMTAKITVK